MLNVEMANGEVPNVEEVTTIYPDKRKALRGLRIRCLCAFVPIIALVVVLFSVAAVAGDGVLSLMLWCLLAEVPVLYLVMSRKIKAQTKPIVSLSSQGITINTTCSQIGFVRWNEIKNVHAYSLGTRFVGITLHDPKSVYGRVGLKRSGVMQMNELVVPLYKLLRIKVAPINIPQEYLPMSADQLLAQIEAYRAAYS